MDRRLACAVKRAVQLPVGVLRTAITYRTSPSDADFMSPTNDEARGDCIRARASDLKQWLLRRFAVAKPLPLILIAGVAIAFANLLNTSFNESEPIVNHPSEAIDCYARTDLDVLVLGSCVVRRNG